MRVPLCRVLPSSPRGRSRAYRVDAFENEPSFEGLGKHIPPIMHTVLLIWKASPYYNTVPRMVVLMQELGNSLVKKATAFVTGDRLFEMMDSGESVAAVECLRTLLRVLGGFKASYFDYKARSVVEVPENPWTASNNACFKRLDKVKRSLIYKEKRKMKKAHTCSWSLDKYSPGCFVHLSSLLVFLHEPSLLTTPHPSFFLFYTIVPRALPRCDGRGADGAAVPAVGGCENRRAEGPHPHHQHHASLPGLLQERRPRAEPRL